MIDSLEAAIARIDERTLIIMEQLDEIGKCNADQEERIRLLEKWQWKATGIAAGITGFFGMVGGYLFKSGGS